MPTLKKSSCKHVDFSEKINDPDFAKYINNSNRYAAIFASILAVVAIAGFYIYGEMSDDASNPDALYIGLSIGGMFVTIALFQIWGRNNSKTWDGTVVEKSTVIKQKKSRNDDQWRPVTVFSVYIEDEQGKTHSIDAENDDTIYNYYKIGDKVRHHKGLHSYEKKDKTGDSIIFCNACASLNKIDAQYCICCKCPLLN